MVFHSVPRLSDRLSFLLPGLESNSGAGKIPPLNKTLAHSRAYPESGEASLLKIEWQLKGTFGKPVVFHRP
jgi:hypothetical protein